MPPTNNNYNYALTTMMTKHFCISMIFAAIAGGAAFAQEPELNKEITVDKDFVPVEQKATKSNILPEVYNPQVSKGAGKIGYSDWAVPVEVPATAATLPPYGYGTTHNATDNRGYFEFGIGTCLNMLGSAGYRVVDLDGTKMSIWLQHNSTWTGENKSANSPFAIDQHWNDNVIGVDFMHRFGKGDLSGGTLDLHVGANTDNIITMDVYNFIFSKLASAAGVDDTLGGIFDDNGTVSFDVSTQSGANAAIDRIQSMIELVDSQRADLGAVQNRLESSIRNQSNVSANSADARSRIRDADFAEESANLSQQSIIQQAATSMLMQAAG